MQEFVKKFEKCRKINEFDATFDFEEFRSACSDVDIIKK
jgi:hypothetical protein